MIYYLYIGKPHLPLNLEGGGFMTVSVNISDANISLIASIITIVLFLIQVLRFLFRLLKQIYKKIIHKIAEDVAADIRSAVKKDEEINTIEKADHNKHSKGG